VSVTTLSVTVAVALGIALVVSLIPASLAARRQPAMVLRSE
jgi:ABC-type antimicrobial peptide transport system permease subunit